MNFLYGAIGGLFLALAERLLQPKSFVRWMGGVWLIIGGWEFLKGFVK